MATQPQPISPLPPRRDQLPLEARARVFTALQEVGNDLRADFSVSHLCRRICEAVHEVLGWRYVVLTSWDRDAGMSRVAAVAGDFDDEERNALLERAPHPIDESGWFGREEYRVSHSYFVRARDSDMVADPSRVLFHGERREGEEGRWQTNDFLAVPLEHRGQITGVLSVDEPAGGRLPSLAHIRALEAFANQAAIAISNAEAMSETSRLAEEANQRARFLRSVLEISERIRVNEPLPQVAEYICNAAREILGWRRVVFMFRDLDAGTSRILAVAGYPEEEREEILARPPSELKEQPWWAVEECRISNSYYVDHEKLRQLSVHEEKVHVSELDASRGEGWHEEDLLVVPIVSQGEMWGILSLDDPADGRKPGLQKIQSLEILANQAAVAIENTRLFSQQSTLAEEAESHAAFLDAILQLGQSVLWNTPIEEFGERVCSVIRELLGWRRVVVTVRDERGTTSQPVACTGFSEEEATAIMGRDPVPVHEDPWYVDERFRISESYFVPAEDFRELDAPESELYFSDIGDADDPEAWHEEDFLIVPLRFRDQLIGAVSVDDPVDGRRPDARKVRELEIVGNVAASAVRNAQLFQLVSRGKYEWEAAFDAIGEGIALFDESQRFVRTNRSFAEMVEVPISEFAGYSCCDLLADEEHDVIHDLLEAVLGTSEEEPKPAETRLRGRMVRVSGYPMGDQAVLVFEDITEQRILERQVIQTEKMAAMGELMAGIAHDLNNPLTTVLGFSEIVEQREDVPEDARSMLELIRTQADRATRIVRNLLAFARRQEGEREFSPPGQIVDDSLQLLAHQARLNQVEIVNDVSPDLPPVEVVTNQVEQVFVNLLQNAIQAISSEADAGTIRVSAEAASGSVILHFDDSGPGVPEEIREQIFEPFFTTKPEGRGTGLGLSIARSIIREHGGSLAVSRSDLGGARISLRLPASSPGAGEGAAEGTEAGGVAALDRPGSAVAAETGVASPGGPVPVEEAAAPPELREEREEGEEEEEDGPVRVLLIDDESHILTFLSVALENEGFDVDRADGGVPGLEKARQGGYDLIICDLRMPDLDGREVYRILSEEEPEVASRVLFSTGDTIRGGVMEFLEDLGRPFLPKPYSLAQIREVVEDFLAQV